MLWRRSEESCERNGGMVGVPIVLEPVVVPVPLVAVPVEAQHTAVAVRVEQKCVECRLYRPSLTA